MVKLLYYLFALIILSIVPVSALDISQLAAGTKVNLNKNRLDSLATKFGVDLSAITGTTITKAQITIQGIYVFANIAIVYANINGQYYTIIIRSSML